MKENARHRQDAVYAGGDEEIRHEASPYRC